MSSIVSRLTSLPPVNERPSVFDRGSATGFFLRFKGPSLRESQLTASPKIDRAKHSNKKFFVSFYLSPVIQRLITENGKIRICDRVNFPLFSSTNKQAVWPQRDVCALLSLVIILRTRKNEITIKCKNFMKTFD